jgi:hypothetical protein
MIRRVLKLISLSVMLMVALAVIASAAQAEENAKWLILTATGLVKTGEELQAILESALENADGSLLTKIVGIKVKFLCSTATLVGANLEGGGKITSGFKIKFTGCATYLNEELAPECETHSSGQSVGTILTNELKGLIVLHEPSAGVKEGVVRIEPMVGTTLVTLTLGAACPAGNNVPIIGNLYVKDCEGKFTTHLVKHLAEELKALTKMWAISKTTEHIATLDGSTLVFLGGAHAGLAWGGMPG